MTKEEYQYQFNGYSLPKIQFDETGPAYTVIDNPHPYYFNQPLYWSKPAYGGVPSNQGLIERQIELDNSGGVLNAQSSQSGEQIQGVYYNVIPIDLL